MSSYVQDLCFCVSLYPFSKLRKRHEGHSRSIVGFMSQVLLKIAKVHKNPYLRLNQRRILDINEQVTET